MNTKISGMVVAAVVACASVVSISLAAQNSSSVNTPVTALKYGPTGVSDGVHGELNAAPPMATSVMDHTARSSRCPPAS